MNEHVSFYHCKWRCYVLCGVAIKSATSFACHLGSSLHLAIVRAWGYGKLGLIPKRLPTHRLKGFPVSFGQFSDKKLILLTSFLDLHSLHNIVGIDQLRWSELRIADNANAIEAECQQKMSALLAEHGVDLPVDKLDQACDISR